MIHPSLVCQGQSKRPQACPFGICLSRDRQGAVFGTAPEPWRRSKVRNVAQDRLMPANARGHGSRGW
jgi:hypothetical protein